MKKILIIEDEEHLREMYKIKFVLEGFEVITAKDGEKGLALAKSEKPDLVLLDIIMPKINGFEVLEKIREDKSTKKMHVYILSNLGQDDEIERSKELGADGFFVKANLTPTQLAEKIKKII